MPDHKLIISFALPIISLAIIVSFLVFTKPAAVGFTVVNANITPLGQTIEADVTLITNPNELMPETVEIAITLDDRTASMTIKEFIEKTGQEFSYQQGKMEQLNYEGYGYTGNYTYKLPLSAFNLDRNVKPGSHVLKTQIKYNNLILFERENPVVIS